jgi:aspartyl-tRNA(Asn)/glutamyl-tRNA(Gln) amidotransferase subunit A
MKAQDFLDDAAIGSIDIVENTHKALRKAQQIDNDYNYFYNFNEDAIRQAEEIQRRINEGQRLRFAGLPVSVKDCICVKGLESAAGSRILQGYRPLFDATAIKRLKQEGAIIMGKTTQDEFGFGSFSTNTHKFPKNPHDMSRCTGGSSGGSAGMTAKADFAHISIAESTGGSIACPASFCGVIGLTPTYGRVSRYGLIDYANSLDKIGVMGKNIFECKLALEIMSGKDDKDGTSLDAFSHQKRKIRKVGVIKETLSEGIDEGVRINVMRTIQNLEDFGIVAEEISLPLSSGYALAAYYIIAMSEASTNLAKYCGLRYGAAEKLDGNFNEYFSNVRSKYFGDEAKRRIILGTFARQSGFREAFYLKAMKLRTLIIEEYKKAFNEYDLLVSPTMPVIAPKFSAIQNLTPMQNYLMDIMTVGPNLAGLPHLTLNSGMSNSMPVGIQFIADHMKEDMLVSMGEMFEP